MHAGKQIFDPNIPAAREAHLCLKMVNEQKSESSKNCRIFNLYLLRT